MSRTDGTEGPLQGTSLAISELPVGDRQDPVTKFYINKYGSFISDYRIKNIIAAIITILKTIIIITA